jgi:hypothetical protein
MGARKPDRLGGNGDVGLDQALLDLVIDEHRRGALPRLERLWTYFRDPAEPVGAAGGAAPLRWRTGQARGLPARFRVGVEADPLGGEPPEVVTENDIAWRVQTMVDFMFGRPVQILSTAHDGQVRGAVETVLDAVWEASGGIGLMQDTALLGHVYGYVDLLVRMDEVGLTKQSAFVGALESGAREALGGLVRIEVVEPRRGIPVMNADDYRRLDAYVIHLERSLNEIDGSAGGAWAARSGWRAPWAAGRAPSGRGAGRGRGPSRRSETVTEVLGPGTRVVRHGDEVVRRESSVLLPGVVPVVHIQNLSQPFRYEGLSEVEPLIGLQDELNTRLSDRAARVTMSSFKMYLAKRLDGFENARVGPGAIWSTDDPDAGIEAFGGDSPSPGESEHVEQVREAMDKVSGVPPLAGGVVRAKIGNLSSANALRITLMSLLAKTARKRITYGAGIERVCRMVLTALDAAGVLRTHPGDRGVKLVWPRPAADRSELGADRGEAEAGAGRRAGAGARGARVRARGRGRELRVSRTREGDGEEEGSPSPRPSPRGAGRGRRSRWTWRAGRARKERGMGAGDGSPPAGGKGSQPLDAESGPVVSPALLGGSEGGRRRSGVGPDRGTRAGARGAAQRVGDGEGGSGARGASGVDRAGAGGGWGDRPRGRDAAGRGGAVGDGRAGRRGGGAWGAVVEGVPVPGEPPRRAGERVDGGGAGGRPERDRRPRGGCAGERGPGGPAAVPAGEAGVGAAGTGGC